MANVILNAAKFLKVLSVGDTFWYMSSDDIKPLAIVGPCVVDKIGAVEVDGGNEEPLVLVTYHRGKKVESNSVSYLTDRWRGVFLSKNDATKYLASRKKAFATDKKLIALVKKRKQEFIDSLQEDPWHS